IVAWTPGHGPAGRPRRRHGAVALTIAALAGAATAPAHAEPADCTAVEDTDFERVVQCMSLEELAGQLTAFNEHIARRLTGKSLEDNVRAGLGTVMGVSADPEKIRRLQKLAQDHGHPPLLSFEDTERGVRTILPSSLAQSFTWNLDLVERGARMAARESAAVGLSGILGPVSDHSCTTRNGRSMETKGESPYLAARYVERIVRGFQGDSLDAPDTVAATLKHWIGYQCSDDGTDYRGADISELELLETHAPPFEAGFKAGAALFMPAFTQLNGMPMHMNGYANARLRARLGGAHAVSIGDHTGDVELIEHGVAGDMCDAAFKVFGGGLHISLEGGLYLPCLPELVARGRIARADVEARVLEVLRLKERLGLYEDRLRFGRPAKAEQILLSPEHRRVARQLAREALVMLTKPEPMPLPFERGTRILVTGPLAENRQAMLGEWSARGRPEDVITPCEGLERFFGKEHVICVPIEAVDRIRGDELEAAIDVASGVDAIVVMLGEARFMSGEASTRLYPEIPAAQYRLVEALQSAGKPLIAIQTAGRAVPVSRLAGLLPQRSGSADVVFFTSQLGIEAGNGIADVLGGVHPPSGRLSLSLPCESGIISASFRERRTGRPRVALTGLMHEFRERIGNSGKWVSHFQETFERDDCPIAFPFGHGLSYTDFSYSSLRLSAKELKAGDADAHLEASVTITNEGQYRGVAVPQLYLRDMVAVPAPRRLELRGFERIELPPGESAEVTFRITPADLAIYTIDPRTGHLDLERGRTPQPDEYPVMVFVGASSGVSDATPQSSFVLIE
ncbi:MAG: glycoside hydrolase family 3 N-terminal domain-containing protein, partial [Geminicoccaceae bacterium]